MLVRLITLFPALLYLAKPVDLPDASRRVHICKPHETISNQSDQRVRTLYGGKSQRRNRGLHDTTFYAQKLDELRDQPLSTLLDFGHIFSTDLKETMLHGDSTVRYTAHHDTCLKLSHICHYTLNRVAGIQIQWVHDMIAYLIFDSRSKKLNIFQYPSVCLVFGSSESISDSSERPTIFSR